MLPSHTVAIDEEGFPLFGELRVTDPQVAVEILSQIRFAENGAFLTTLKGDEVIVEAFDDPYVAAQVLKLEAGWRILLPYGLEMPFDLKSLTLDEWDRFHGKAQNGIPFVFSRKAQAEFFNLVDEFDDESITVDDEIYELPTWLPSAEEVRKGDYWSHIYQTETPRWELNEAAPALKDMLPRLKLPKSRILVLGCGSGNDAAFFAEQGHVVTAVDISAEALDQAKKKYEQYKNITWIQSDLFKIGHDQDGSYDLIFEHTCYCAIDPQKRNDLVALWR
ncbi:MAG: class I SAM-dependent methyltransferase, partial [Pseudobdellovibrionaceae bacterium]